MRKILVIGILSIFFVSGYTLGATGFNVCNQVVFGSTGDMFYVGGSGPGNYTAIQEALDAASDGDCVYVFHGIYRENIVVSKSVKLVGEDRNSTIIDGNQEGCTITLSSEQASIHQFTITGGGFDTDEFSNFFRAGIRITGSHNQICNNIFKRNNLGISGVRVTNLTINNNSFIEDGIGFTVYENDGRPELKPAYFQHHIENNLVNGRPFYYICNEKDQVFDSCEMGQVLMVNCTNVTIKNSSISQTDWGLVLAFCNGCVIERCALSNNSLAIWTLQSNRNRFVCNNVSNNYHRGIVIDYNSNRNLIQYNTIAGTFCGVQIEWWSNANVVTRNNILATNVSGNEHQSLFSMWYKNYYCDWIGLKKPLFFFFPKAIYGMPIEKIPQLHMPVSIDLFPAKEPYKFDSCWV